jgi:hypothetical protein
MSLGKRRRLFAYLRGPRICSRFDVLPWDVQHAARSFSRRVEATA